MVGSSIGRATLALPVLLACVSIGAVTAGTTGDLGTGTLVAGGLALPGLLRVARTGVLVDLDRGRIVLRTFWRTRRISLDRLHRIEAAPSPDTSLPTLRVVTGEGRIYGTRVLAYLRDEEVEQLLEDLRMATERAPFDVRLDRTSFRRATP